MQLINPMFNRKNTRKADTPLKTNNEPVQRKKRSDAKNDVKIPFDASERQRIKILARKYNTTPTQYVTSLLKLGLKRGKAYPHVPYSATNKKPIHAKLSALEYEKLFECTVEWDCSHREAAYRIVSQLLKHEMGWAKIE